MEFKKEQKDVMDAEAILEQLEKLIESERSENEKGDELDIRELEEAKAHLNAFVAAEKKEMSVDSPSMDVSMEKPVVNTDVLTGPINGLKSFLIKKQQSKA